MSSSATARLMLGRPDKGDLILLAGPAHDAMKQLAASAGIEVRELRPEQGIWDLKAAVARQGRSLALIARIPEIDGLLDRSAFGRDLSDLAHRVDRVLYGGTTGTVLVHPLPRGTRMCLTDGVLHMRHRMDAPAGTLAGGL